MKFAKKWWRELLLIALLPFIGAAWSYIHPLLEQYGARGPAYFYIASELLWNITAAFTAYHALKSKGWFSFTTIRGAPSISSDKLVGKAWTFFRLNRIVALLQPAVTVVLMLLTEAPTTVKLIVTAVMLFDLLHTIATIRRSKAWQKKEG